MAEMDTSSKDTGKKGPGVKKSKKMSTRVDLTPMVDLGFLLITFFMFTTTMSQPTSMNLKMPDDNENAKEQNVKQSGALTIWLGDNDRIYYYDGELSPDLSNVKSTDFKGIRDVILAKKQAVANPDDLFMIVMPGNKSTYKNIIDMLDEFSIDVVERYALVNKVDTAYSAYIEKMDAAAGQAGQ